MCTVSFLGSGFMPGATPGRRAGDDNVAGLQHHELRQVAEV
jgi:hypothetical protein